jgi:hypothetical protein
LQSELTRPLEDQSVRACGASDWSATDLMVAVQVVRVGFHAYSPCELATCTSCCLLPSLSVSKLDNQTRTRSTLSTHRRGQLLGRALGSLPVWTLELETKFSQSAKAEGSARVGQTNPTFERNCSLLCGGTPSDVDSRECSPTR